MNFLVTGGAGFIGSNFLLIMVKKYPQYNFLCLDNLTYSGCLKNIEEIMNYHNFRFMKGDITDRVFVLELFKKYKFDYVINFAAETSVDKSLNDPEIFFKTNVLGVLTLLDASLKYYVKRFHQISTDEVYGPSKTIMKNNEKSKLNPSSPYSASKASADLLVLSYHHSYNLPVTVSRSSNNYGKNQALDKLIPLAVYNISKNFKMPIYGDGKNIRNWLYVEDHVNALDYIIHNGKNGKIYNIKGKTRKNNLQMIEIISKILAKPNYLVDFIEDRKGHDYMYSIKNSRDLNHLKESNFTTKISETVKWYAEKFNNM